MTVTDTFSVNTVVDYAAACFLLADKRLDEILPQVYIHIIRYMSIYLEQDSIKNLSYVVAYSCLADTQLDEESTQHILFQMMESYIVVLYNYCVLQLIHCSARCFGADAKPQCALTLY